jgi:hypothetical protein
MAVPQYLNSGPVWNSVADQYGNPVGLIPQGVLWQTDQEPNSNMIAQNVEATARVTAWRARIGQPQEPE